MRSRYAIRLCAYWLSECLKLGWKKEDLDKLEALWWEHHNEETGEFRAVEAEEYTVMRYCGTAKAAHKE